MKLGQKIYLPFKRLIGIIGSLIGIAVCFVFLWWWVIPINAVATKGHPFFNRPRVGKNGKAFTCLKFRSMGNDTDPHLTSRDDKSKRNLTGFGKFLRATSIDETPQLFNILFGQMAFIGPRPLIDASDDSITINKRKENGSIVLRPGLSGYAQIHDRAGLDPIKKAEYDFMYLNKFSLLFDIKIFFLTIFSIFTVNKGK